MVREVIAHPLGDGRVYRRQNPPGLPSRLAAQAPTNDVFWLNRWNQEVLTFYLGWTWRLPMIFHGDFNGLGHERVVALTGALEQMAWKQRLSFLAAGSVRAIVTHETLHLPGIERVDVIDNVSGQRFYVYRHENAAPRAVLSHVWMQAADGQKALEAMFAPGFDPRQHAVIEGEVDLRPQPGCEDPGSLDVRVDSVRQRTFTVRSECPVMLVLSDPLYKGWEALVDARPAEVLSANFSFSAIALEAGEHEVIWRYAPRSVRLGLGLSMASLLLVCIGLLRKGGV